ncbi:hypothetical protein [Streptomyces katsurahamanus]|uniref:Uncharacterized protein n=1 Tax=Streptomyces katsurahamanus TaxID=2577098 RepID=A0ABW9NWZ8_9ACTN|nr:hypothetical protein [Streptomyces katsurahamanus]MQS37694.1 hypothetical protein [Streptomyces katsurahamanus]
MDRQGLAAAHSARCQDLIDSQTRSLAMECRDDLLETAAVLDALTLCHGHGSYLPRPYQDDSANPVPQDVELRTDASDQLVRHDHQHGTSTTGDIPPALGRPRARGGYSHLVLTGGTRPFWSRGGTWPKAAAICLC